MPNTERHEEAVEAAAKAILKDDVLRPRTDSGLGGLRPMTWKELNESERVAYRNTAQSAIAAYNTTLGAEPTNAEAELHNALLEIDSDWSDWAEADALKRVLQIADDALEGRPRYPLATVRDANPRAIWLDAQLLELEEVLTTAPIGYKERAIQRIADLRATLGAEGEREVLPEFGRHEAVYVEHPETGEREARKCGCGPMCGGTPGPVPFVCRVTDQLVPAAEPLQETDEWQAAGKRVAIVLPAEVGSINDTQRAFGPCSQNLDSLVIDSEFIEIDWPQPAEPLQETGEREAERDSLFDFRDETLIALKDLVTPLEDLPQSDRLLRLIERALESKRATE